MNTRTKNSLVQAAALSAIWVVASTFAGQTATAKIETRHHDMAVATAFQVLEQAGQYTAARHETGAAKGDLQVQKPVCTGQAWPYIAAECLNGTPPARQVSRTITIEKRTGEAGSALVRVAAEPQMAAR
jgi:hypothetical protein